MLLRAAGGIQPKDNIMKIQELMEVARGIPGKPGWEPALERGRNEIKDMKKKKKNDAYMAGMLYDTCQSVPKRYFLDFLKALKVKPDAKFKKELQKAKDVGLKKDTEKKKLK